MEEIKKDRCCETCKHAILYYEEIEEEDIDCKIHIFPFTNCIDNEETHYLNWEKA